MALFNYASREMTAKIVYYGPAVCGKTTSLQVIHQTIAPHQRGKLLSLATETDRTIFFDLLPLKLGEIKGFKLKFQLYTVPGQVKYNKTRKVVLQGADAIVFVADSQRSRRQANLESFKNLQENLLEQGRRLEDLPLVYEYNKRDLDAILSVEELNQDLNPRNLSYFEAIASQGKGIMETLEAISKATLEDLENRLLLDQKSKVSGAVLSKLEKKEEPKIATPVTSEDILDLTLDSPLEEPALAFSKEDLAGLQLESDLLDLSSQPDYSGPSTEESLLASSKPIGYGDDIQIEELDLAALQIADEDLNLKSQFYDLKKVEEEAFRDLENFLGPLEKDSEGEDQVDLDIQQPFEKLPIAPSAEEDLLDFKLEPEYEESQEDIGRESLLLEGEDDSLNLDLEGKEKSGELASLTSDMEEKTGPEELLSFDLEGEKKMSEVPASNWSTLEEGPMSSEANNLKGPTELSFRQEKSFISPELTSIESPGEISEKEPAEDLITSEAQAVEEQPQDSIEASKPSVPTEETFSMPEDPFIGLMGFSRYLCQTAQEHLAEGTESDYSLCVFLCYAAAETGLKAVASKFETCNPAIAAMPIVLDSIEEETGKPIGGRKFLEERIIKVKNDLQLNLLFPDAETCQLVIRTTERFLETLAQDFLSVNFSQIPLIPMPSSQKPS